MEGKKLSFVDELFPLKAATSPSKPDILSSIFRPPSSVAESDLFHYESVPVKSIKQESQSQSSNLQRPSAGIFHDSSSRKQNLPKENGDNVVSCEIAETFHMSSSVYYGGRDDYVPHSSSSYNRGKSFDCKEEEDHSSNSDAATRGEWWHGMMLHSQTMKFNT